MEEGGRRDKLLFCLGPILHEEQDLDKKEVFPGRKIRPKGVPEENVFLKINVLLLYSTRAYRETLVDIGPKGVPEKNIFVKINGYFCR